MSRVYGEPVDVWVRDGRPARFAWRGRLYTVLGVLEHWVVSREWWKQQAQEESGKQGSEPSHVQGGGPAGPSGHEFWRGDASPGRNLPLSTFERRPEAGTRSRLAGRVLGWGRGPVAGVP